MIHRLVCWLSVSVAIALPLHAQEVSAQETSPQEAAPVQDAPPQDAASEPAPPAQELAPEPQQAPAQETPVQDTPEQAPPAEQTAENSEPANEGEPGEIPADLLDEEHMREELGINEFTAPSISKLFDTLQFLMPLPLVETERAMPDRMPLDRADLAIELGFLIANGFLVVQAEQLEKVETLAADLTRYGKALGAGDRVNRHAASLLDSAKKPDVAQLKKELAATQRDVEAELVSLKDADLAHLISMGGWIRALEVSTVAVDKQFSEERARKVMREDIADYYTESIAGLEPRISERPNYLAMRDLLAGLRTEMTLQEGQAPTPEMMREIRQIAAQLVNLALQRKQ
ncbi:MAG: hypothetical protein ACO3F7_03585 [Luteolibacter sp.]